jgi:hypothetical protein
LIGDSATTDLKPIFTLNIAKPVCAGYEYLKSTSLTSESTAYSDSRVTFDQTAQSLTVTSSSYTPSAITFYTYMRSTGSYLFDKKQMELNIYKCSPVNAEVLYKIQKNTGSISMLTKVAIEAFFSTTLSGRACTITGYFISETTETTAVTTGTVYTTMLVASATATSDL